MQVFYCLTLYNVAIQRKAKIAFVFFTRQNYTYLLHEVLVYLSVYLLQIVYSFEFTEPNTEN